MYRAIALFGMVTLLTSFAQVVSAQATPIGSASALGGIQERSVKRTNTNSASPAAGISTSAAPADQPRPLLDPRLRFDVSPERGALQTGVFPVDNTSSGNRVQVLYELNDLLPREVSR